MKEFIKRIPLVGPFLQRAVWALNASASGPEPFAGSAAYWETRYAAGGNSGAGSYALFAEFKAEILNRFVEQHGIQSVIEFGCGDGNQLRLANYPNYLGVDISHTAVEICRKKFASDPRKVFSVSDEYIGQKADLALSLDVIYHLVEDSVFDSYMETLFSASAMYLIIYASDTDDNTGTARHVFHRKLTQWITTRMPAWKLIEHIPNKYPYAGDHHTGSSADFFIYKKNEIPV